MPMSCFVDPNCYDVRVKGSPFVSVKYFHVVNLDCLVLADPMEF